MDLIHYLLNIILHLDEHLITFVNLYGIWVYALLFLIIFCETGLVITPFLPGDSLLFAAGAIAASTESLNIHMLFILLTCASILGNSLNYAIGYWVGPKLFYSTSSKLFNSAYLKKAHEFYEKHGGKTIIVARFIPIIRTFAPFVAGLSYMQKKTFLAYNFIGAVLWVGGLLYVSYWFGNLPFIKQHFSTVVLTIIMISLLPAGMGYICSYRRSAT